ncbi:hypothetical protein ANN_17392, partial [Periplaneta americana]
KDDSSYESDDNADNSKSDHQSKASEVSNHRLEPQYDPETPNDEDLSINEKSSYHQCDPQETARMFIHLRIYKICNIGFNVPKPNKAVVVLSALPHTQTISEEETKPQIILHCNSTKGDIDTLDH